MRHVILMLCDAVGRRCQTKETSTVSTIGLNLPLSRHAIPKGKTQESSRDRTHNRKVELGTKTLDLRASSVSSVSSRTTNVIYNNRYKQNARLRHHGCMQRICDERRFWRQWGDEDWCKASERALPAGPGCVRLAAAAPEPGGGRRRAVAAEGDRQTSDAF